MAAATAIRRSGQEGQSLVEYALILVLVAVAVVIMLVATGAQFHNLYSDITTSLHNQAGM